MATTTDGLDALLAAADGRSVSASTIILVLIGAAIAWRYVKGFSITAIKPEVQLSAAVWNDLKTKLDQHETRISRIEGRLGVPPDLIGK